MKKITLPADTAHLYLDEIAHFIADYFNPEGPNDPDGVRYGLDKIQAENEIHQAANDGSLSVMHPGTHGPFPKELGLKRAVALVPDVVDYLAARGITMVIEAPEQTTQPQAAPEQEAATSAPVGAVSASGGADSTKAGPLPLTTGDIAFCFAGLRWNEQEWKKPLGDKPKWLLACIAIPGVRGVSESRWNPVRIGASLVSAGHAKPKSVRAKFQTQPLLKHWLDEWKTYEADNLSAD